MHDDVIENYRSIFEIHHHPLINTLWIEYVPFVFSTIPLDLIPERKPKPKMESSIDEINCSDTCNTDWDCEEEIESGVASKISSRAVSPPSVLVQDCTPPSDEEHFLSKEVAEKSCSEECEYH